MMHTSMKMRKAFTVVEVLVAVVVIGVLAVLGVVAYSGIQADARDKAVLSDLNAVQGEVARYASKHQGRYSSILNWYSNGPQNSNINFSPSSGNVIDVVATESDYCVRVYNKGSKTYSSLDAAAFKSSNGSACGLAPSTIAEEEANTFTSISWQRVDSLGSASWVDVASSSDGTVLVGAVNNGYIYISRDRGATWQQSSAGSRLWQGVAISSDGSTMFATTRSVMYSSVDYGASWNPVTSAGSRDWRRIAISPDGSRAAAVVANGYVYTSTNGGVSWVELTQAGSRDYRDIAMSANGTKLLATVYSQYAQLSIDSGSTWATTTAIGLNSGMNPDGDIMVTSGTGATFQRSTNSGMSWQTIGSSSGSGYRQVAVSTDGARLLAVKGSIYSSSDAGVSFSVNSSVPSNSYGYEVAMSNSGARVVAAGSGTYLYVGVYH